MIHKSITLLLMTLFFSLITVNCKPSVELELTYYGRNNISLSLSGTYNIDCIEARISSNHRKSFPNNISLQALPIHKSTNTIAENSFATTMATSFTVASGVLIYVAKKEIEKIIDNKKTDLLLQRCDKLIEKTAPTFEKIEGQLIHG